MMSIEHHFVTQLSIQHFSDRHVGASDEEKAEHEKRFKDVAEAYGILSDSRKRARFDAGQDLDNSSSSDSNSHFSHNNNFSTHNMDAAQIFKAFFGNGAGMHHAFHHHFGFGNNMHGGTSFQFSWKILWNCLDRQTLVYIFVHYFDKYIRKYS